MGRPLFLLVAFLVFLAFACSSNASKPPLDDIIFGDTNDITSDDGVPNDTYPFSEVDPGATTDEEDGPTDNEQFPDQTTGDTLTYPDEEDADNEYPDDAQPDGYEPDDLLADGDELYDSEMPDQPTPICTPYETIECLYNGPAEKKDVGLCKAATKTCNGDGLGWSACTGEVLPTTEVCNSGFDENCNGFTDEDVDEDGDGWSTCGGDCCDNTDQCTDPLKVNPGAIEVPGDGVDNDCNGQKDE
ncbi:MAG TPA: MopE-related protein, partial [bacterium]|nr:MopE-related protein [bacterium]